MCYRHNKHSLTHINTTLVIDLKLSGLLRKAIKTICADTLIFVDWKILLEMKWVVV